MLRKGLTKKYANNRILKANNAFPDALVQNYQGLIQHLKLPDKNDCHILATAIKTNANLIVTNNLKDFPEEYLKSFGLSAKSEDDFLTDIIDLDHEKAVEAFKEMVLYKKNPKQDEHEVLDMMKKVG